MYVYLFKVWNISALTFERISHRRVVIHASNIMAALKLLDVHPDLIEYVMNEKKEYFKPIFNHSSQCYEFGNYVKPFKYFPNGDFKN